MDELPRSVRGLPIDHVGIAVNDVEEASRPYLLVGLIQVGEDEIIATQHVRVRALWAGDSLIELLEPTRPESPIAKFLDERGEGLHHLALRVDDIEAEVERLVDVGARFIDPEPRPGRAGSRVVFLHPNWSGRVLLELVEHS